MGKPRKHNRHLPRGMQLQHGAYYFVRDKKWTRLAAEYGPALIAYAALVGEMPQVTRVGDAITHYLESSAGRLEPKTLEGYGYSAKNLIPIFGHMGLDELQPAHVYRYLVERGDVQANRDRSLLSAAYTHARRIGAFTGDDPAKGLQFRNKEQPRSRYVTDDEQAALTGAQSEKLACITRFLHLTAMRQGDALRVRMTDITEEGIQYTAGKTKHSTGRTTMVTWSPELRECVEDARRIWRRFGREWLFESHPRGKHAKRGPGPYTPSGLRALWRVARLKAGKADPKLLDVTLHDLRRKGGSDVEETHAQALLGHSDVKVTRRHYRAKADRVKPVR